MSPCAFITRCPSELSWGDQWEESLNIGIDTLDQFLCPAAREKYKAFGRRPGPPSHLLLAFHHPPRNDSGLRDSGEKPIFWCRSTWEASLVLLRLTPFPFRPVTHAPEIWLAGPGYGQATTPK